MTSGHNLQKYQCLSWTLIIGRNVFPDSEGAVVVALSLVPGNRESRTISSPSERTTSKGSSVFVHSYVKSRPPAKRGRRKRESFRDVSKEEDWNLVSINATNLHAARGLSLAVYRGLIGGLPRGGRPFGIGSNGTFHFAASSFSEYENNARHNHINNAYYLHY